MKKKRYIILFILFYLTCRTAGEKTLEGDGAVDELKLRGYTKFTIFKGINLLGYAQNPKNPKEFPKKVWKLKGNALKTSKVEQRLVLEYGQDKFKEAKVALFKIVEFDAGYNKFQKIRLILENPVEYVWKDVQLIKGVKPKLLKQKYIRGLLQVSRILLEFETKDGKRLKTGTDLINYGVALGVNAKTSESENVVFFAKDAYVGYKLAEPPKVAPQKTQVADRFQRVLIAPFFVNSKQDKGDLERLLYNASRDALNRVPNIKALERDPGVLYAESQLKDRKNINKLKDVASLQGADLIFVGEFHRYGNDVVAKVQGFLRDSEGEIVPGRSVKFTVEDISKVQFLSLGDKWEKELLNTFEKWTPKKEGRSTQNELAYKEYLKGLDEIAKLDEDSVGKAIQYFEKAVDLDSKFAEAYAMLSEAYTESVKLKYGVVSNLSEEEKRKKADFQEKALQAGNKALELKPNSSLAYRSLGKHYFHIGYIKKALESAQKSTELDPKDARAAWLLFFVKAEDDKRILYDKNNPDYQVSYRLNPNLFESLRNMGLISEKQEEYNKAIEYYKKALEKSPKHLETHFDLARAYRKKKKFDESFKLLESAEKFYPKNYRVWRNLAYHYRDKKDYPKVEKYYKKILNEDTKHFVNVASDVIDFYSNYYGKPDEGIKLFQRAIKKDLKHEEYYYGNIGSLYRGKENFLKAIDSFQKSIEIKIRKFGPNHQRVAYGYWSIGLTYLIKNEYEKAIVYYNKSLEIYQKQKNMNLAFGYTGIGIAYASRGEYNNSKDDTIKGIDYFQKALNIYKNKLGSENYEVAELCNGIAISYSHIPNYEKAIEYYKKSLKIFLKKLGQDSGYVAYVYFNIGKVYNDKKDFNTAESYLQKSLKIYQKNLGLEHLYIARTYIVLGDVYLNKKEYNQAIEYCNKSLFIRLKTLGSKHSIIVPSYNYLKSVLKTKEHYQKAITLFKQSTKDDPKNAKWYEEKIEELKHEMKEIKKRKQ